MPARFAGTVKMSARYICSGSAVFSPRRKAGVGVVGVATTSQAAKRLLEVAADQRADLLRAQVVRVVVAGGEHERAEDDAALHLRRRSRWSRVSPYMRAQVGAPAARAGRSARRRSARGCSRPRRWPRCSRSRWRGGAWGSATSTTPRARGLEGLQRLAEARPARPASTPFSRKAQGTPMRRPGAPPSSAAGEVGHGARRRWWRRAGRGRTGRDGSEGRVLDACARRGRPGRATTRRRRAP